MYTRVKTPAELKALRTSCKIDAKIVQTILQRLEVGMTGIDVNELAKREIKAMGVEPAYLGFEGYPAVICISTNDAVAHGIPNSTPFADGDLVSIDLGVRYDGMISDMCRTVVVGESTPEKDRLMAGTQEALTAAIKVIKHGATIGDIGAATQAVMQRYKFGIVRDLVGHGVGHFVHEDPSIPHYGTPGTGDKLEAGMTICVEPMATLGAGAITFDSDGWTARTADRSLCAQFEETILVTEESAEILTVV